MLIDRTGRNLKIEPLATVSSLERHLLKMVMEFELCLITLSTVLGGYGIYYLYL